MSKKWALSPITNDNFVSLVQMSGKYALVGMPGDDIGNKAGEGSVMRCQESAITGNNSTL